MVDILDRARAFFREHPVTTDRKVNQFLTENLPRLAKEYNLATVKDCAVIDGRMDDHEGIIANLEKWQAETSSVVDSLRGRITKLEVNR